MNSALGRIISGRYKIVALAGQGGMGKAYKAVPCLAPTETVVIKLISHRNELFKVDELHRFQIEASHLSKLYHPHIVSFHEFGITDENVDAQGLSYYLVMDWVDGESLKELIQREVNDLSFFFELGMQIAQALDYTHRKNIIHRDLKPSNIMIRKSKAYQRGLEAVILDFGIARLRQSMHFAGDSSDSLKGGMLGTPLYMSPEQTGFSEYLLDHRTDLYSLGCILFEVLTGRPPFYRGGRTQILKEHARSKPPSLRSLVASIPADVDYIVSKLLAKNPAHRYQSGMQLYIDLKQLQHKPLVSIAESKMQTNIFESTRQSRVDFQINQEQKKNILDLIIAQKDGDNRGTIISIQSEGGGGKSKILEYLQRDLKSQNIRYISGEFLDYASALPFHVISSAFNDFIKYVASSKDEIESLCNEIKKRIGDEVSTLCSLVPMLQKYFPTDILHSVDSLTNAESFQTVVKVFADFLKCIGIDKKNLVFMFDDLHKADVFSVKLLDVFVSYSNTQNFILILTYHPYFLFRKPFVSQFLKKVQQLKRRFFPVVLKKMSLGESKKFLASQVDLKAFGIDVDRVVEVTKGNPRSLTNFCISLMSNSNFTIKDGKLNISYNMETILELARVASIEQCLMSLESYSADEWAVVETLSILGVVFTDPSELATSLQARRLIEQTIEKLQLDGLLHKLEDNQAGDLAYNYCFSHYHLRQFIYSGIEYNNKQKIHQIMLEHHLGNATEASLESLSVLCHHGLALAQSFDDLPDSHRVKLFETFSQLGNLWKAEEEFHRSELAYQNAFKLAVSLRAINDGFYEQINTSLCDLWFKTKSWDRIISLGERVINEDKESTFSLDLQKSYLIPAYLIEGDYHKVAKLGSLWVESRNLLSQSLKYKLTVGFLKDMMFLQSENLLIQSLLHSLRTKKEPHKGPDDDLHNDLWWLQNLQEIYLNSKILKWLPYHLAAIKIVKMDQYNPLLLLKILAFRAVLWCQNNQYDRAKKVLSLLIDLSYSEQNTKMIGYSTLLKGLIIDYDLNHYGDLKLHLQEGLSYLSPIEHPILVPRATGLKVFLFILAGKFSDADELINKQIKDENGGAVAKIICGALQVFICFVRGRRDLLVIYGEKYLEDGRRLREAGTFEMYFLIIHMFIEYAKGDVHKTRNYFLKISTYFSEGLNSPFLFTFERDFVSLIIFCIPMIFEQEHQRKLMRQQEMAKLLKSLKSQVLSKISGERDIFFLLKAKVLCDLGDRSGEKFFDKALKIAFMLGNDLIACFIYLWYGLNLEDLGSKKQEYISEAYKLAYDKKFIMLQSYIESLIKSESAFFDKSILRSTFIESSLPFNTYPTSLALNHLAYISKSFVEGSTYIHSLSSSLKSLQEAYKGGTICIVLINHSEDDIIFYPYSPENIEMKKHMWDHLQPFLSLAESSFLPSTALSPSLDIKIDEITDDQGNKLDLTNLNQHEDDNQLKIDSDVFLDKTLSPVKNPYNDERGNFDAYVPIESSSGNLGVLMMRGVPEEYSQHNMKMSVKELDLFGAQLGLVIERDFYSKQSVPYSDQWQSHSMESVPWLRIWTMGKLPSNLSSAWSVGLAMPGDQYLIVFCSLQGGERSERQHLSSMLWHHTMVLQVLLKSPDCPVSIDYFRDQFASLLKKTPGADSLGDIALAFTLVSKGSQKLLSGHFGHARPLVLGGNNQVKPFNDAVMSYDNGRELRFWEVLSSWESHLPLLFCPESYRYAEAVYNHRKVEVPLEGIGRGEKQGFSLNSFFEGGPTPPYYLAVLPNYKGGY